MPTRLHLPRLLGLFLLLITLTAHAALATIAPPDTTKKNGVPGPSFRDVMNVKTVGGPAISPDGQHIAYSVRTTDWENNRFDTEIWLARDGETPFQLTRTPDGNSSNFKWSPDGRWLAFTANRGDKNQIYLISPQGGEAHQLTDLEEGVGRYEWSPDGTQMAITVSEPEPEEHKTREKRYGAFEVDDAEYRMTHLWLIDVTLDETPEPNRLTEDSTFTVGSFAWSPDGASIAFDHRPNPLINSFVHADLSVLDVASKAISPLVTRPGADSGPIWSPDGDWVLFGTAEGDSAYYLNRELAKIPATGGDIITLTGAFDENPGAIDWTDDGIYFIASIRTTRRLFHLDPNTGATQQVVDMPEMIWSVDFADDGQTIALRAESRTTLSEIYKTSLNAFDPVPITAMTDQVADWDLGTREVIQWASEDGAEIEGILFKPPNYDPNRPYPLLVVIHGGPTGTSRPQLLSAYVYPVTQWLAQGAVVLMPNYRGSAGYGEAFRSLNVRNLGVGDAWDVLSGVEHLVEQGVAHPDSLGAMGWSQGGYISAFLTTTSSRFRAISVGAGISNWMTYYVNTDIHPFTRHYLQGTPWNDPEVYAKTSPMTYINQAQTPTLIQHGEFDRRVPIPNAYELVQGLRDLGVPSRLVIYKGFGHGITKPKERLAATWHNWQWFSKYIWGKEVELPLDDEE